MDAMNEINDDVVDTREVMDAIADLESQIESDEEQGDTDGDAASRVKRFAYLIKVTDEIETCAGDGCRDGVMLIAKHHFRDYAEELAEDLGLIEDGARWPYTCIDWEAAARDLAMDYSEIEIDGTTYLYR